MVSRPFFLFVSDATSYEDSLYLFLFFEVRTLHKLFITAGADVRRVVALSEAFVLLPFLFFRVNAVESNLLESCCSITQHWGHKVTRFPFLRLP